MLFQICVVLTVTVLVMCDVSNFGQDMQENATTKDSRSCVCVPYYQCKKDYSGLIEGVIDDDDDLDIRTLMIAERVPTGHCTGFLDVCCQVQCGKRQIATDQENRILGENNEANFGEFPWMLGILTGITYRCGASLIHPEVALTAAHCVYDDGPFKVRAGEWNWESWNEPLPHQDRMTKEIIIHPEYQKNSLANDIALLVLEMPFKLSKHIGLACLPPQRMQFDFINCMATGWGKNSFKEGKYQSILKKVSLPVVPTIQCEESLQAARLGPSFKLHKSFICAGGEAKKDACKGDGGSPLICPIVGQPERYQQAGIVSWGLSCGVFDTPGVYVNVALFTEWVDNQMKLLNFDAKFYKF